MPAKRKIQKEDILKASISIISHEGLNALNARKIAKEIRLFNTTTFLYL